MKKLIKISTHQSISAGRKYRQPWADVWIKWTQKPGRTVAKYGPTLISYTDLSNVIRRTEEYIKRYKNKTKEAYENDLKEYLIVKEKLDDGQIVVEKDCKDGMPDIYTPKEYIDRDEAEKMVTEFLKTLGIEPLRFKWARSKFFVQPISI